MHNYVIATEIEFYLEGLDASITPEEVVDRIKAECAKAAIPLFSAGSEKGHHQYEAALMPSVDKAFIIDQTYQFKQLMNSVFSKADFTAKPFSHEPGNGLHIHIHCEDKMGNNLFFDKDIRFTEILRYAIGGLLTWMNPCMPIFAPFNASYARFTAKSNAPTTVSWGTNNRTVAIRLPDKSLYNRHIEHRVAGSDADIGKVIDSLITAMEYGIKHQSDPGEPIYGDASLAQYALPKLVTSLEEALEYQKNASLLRDNY